MIKILIFAIILYLLFVTVRAVRKDGLTSRRGADDKAEVQEKVIAVLKNSNGKKEVITDD